MELSVPVLSSPLERGDEPSILRDVVGCDSNGLAEFFDERAVRPLDADAVAGRSGIAAGAAVDVRDDRVRARHRITGPAAEDCRMLPERRPACNRGSAGSCRTE